MDDELAVAISRSIEAKDHILVDHQDAVSQEQLMSLAWTSVTLTLTGISVEVDSAAGNAAPPPCVLCAAEQPSQRPASSCLHARTTVQMQTSSRPALVPQSPKSESPAHSWANRLGCGTAKYCESGIAFTQAVVMRSVHLEASRRAVEPNFQSFVHLGHSQITMLPENFPDTIPTAKWRSPLTRPPTGQL